MRTLFARFERLYRRPVLRLCNSLNFPFDFKDRVAGVPHKDPGTYLSFCVDAAAGLIKTVCEQSDRMTNDRQITTLHLKGTDIYPITVSIFIMSV